MERRKEFKLEGLPGRVRDAAWASLQDTPENTWTFVNTDTVWKYLQKKKKKKL